MDLLTHGFIPYGITTWMRRPRSERWAAAVAGMAPDLDVSWAWLAGGVNELYPFVHRGITHTVWGAPAMGIILWTLLTRPWVGRRWPRFQDLKPAPDVLPFLLLGGWSHLLLDGLTITGVPALWPASDHRFTTNWFFFSVPYLLLVVAVLWFPHLRRPRSDRYIKAVLAVCVAIIAVAGGIRAATYPHDAPNGARIAPAPLEWRWIVTFVNETGVTAYSTSWGENGAPQHFEGAQGDGFEAARAVCEGHEHFTGWRWNQWGEFVVTANETNGTWTLRFRDSARLYESGSGGGSGLRIFRSEEDRALSCSVSPDGTVTIRRPSGIWG